MTKQVLDGAYAFFEANGYVFELVLAAAAFSWRMPRRRFFVLRLLGATAGLLLLSMGYNALRLPGVWAGCVKTVLLMLLCVPGLRFCCRAGLSRALFAAASAGAAQHLCFKVGQTAASLARPLGAASVWVYPLGFAAALALCWLIFARRLSRIERPQSSRATLWLLLAVQLTTNLLQNLFLLSPGIADRGVYYVFQLYGILVCLFILFLQCEMGSRQAAQQDNALLNQLIYQQKQQLAVRREVIGVINARCHELKQQTAALRGLVPPQQLEALNEAVAVYDTAVDTGSEPLNVLLAEKRLLCKSKQIAFDCMADGHTLAFLRTSDLYALLGNILDNAVAAAEKEPDPARRYIRLEIARRRGMVLVHCENNCIPANLPEVRDGMPLPDSRRGQGPHGFGLQTIRSIAENYGGYCRVGAGDGRFELNLLFPQGEKTQFGAEK